MKEKKIYANLVDIKNKTIYPARIEIENQKISNITKLDRILDTYIIYGFIDAHIHIEGSMMPPSEFARVALTHGTIGAVTDPHEIANILGIKEIEFIIASGKKVPFYFSTGLLSCVPATPFETSGATIGVKESELLIPMEDITHLSEIMNIPAVLNGDKEIFQKMALAKEYQKPIDGHAPLLLRDDLVKGHINLLVRRAVEKSLNLWNVLKCVSINPKEHYNLKSGILQIGEFADFIEIDNLKEFNILKILVISRYNERTKISIDFIEGFALKKGAIASTIAHDSHNIIAVGVNDSELVDAINIYKRWN